MNEVYCIPNVLSEEQRIKLIEDSKPLLLTSEEICKATGANGYFPGKQTLSFLHENPKFYDIFNIFLGKITDQLSVRFDIDRAWINFTDGDKSCELWHNHIGAIYSVVYYATAYNCGTQFENQFVETEINSMLIFPSDLMHTAPVSNVRYDRYVLAMDLI